MKVVTIQSAALLGVDARGVEVEVALTNRLPGLTTVGLPDAALKEGRERIPLAIRHQALLDERPSVIVNLAPAELRKTGAGYELPIALGILIVCGKIPGSALDRFLVVGELSLHGEVRPVRGVLAMASLARSRGLGIIVPGGNATEARLVDGLDVFPVDSLREAVEWLRGERELSQQRGPNRPLREVSTPDLSDVRGQHQARRAAEVASAGGHNLLLVGPPGAGKTMVARRIPGILPPLSQAEALETTRIWSAAGLLTADHGLVSRRPFRAPHHTISSAGLVGGYNPPRPGEVSLAHNGVLFLDELAEFPRAALESLREPIEEGSVRIVRGGVACRFPTRAVLIAATNPCPCGHHGDPRRTCVCSPSVIQRYRGRLSGPLLDRIDLHVEVPRLEVSELAGGAAGESSVVVAERVLRARNRQTDRMAQTGAATNALLGEAAARAAVQLPEREQRRVADAAEKLALSPRAYIRALRVARTIADLGAEERVRLPHVLEAMQYRGLDRTGTP